MEECQDYGIRTLVALDEQGEQLERIEDGKSVFVAVRRLSSPQILISLILLTSFLTKVHCANFKALF